MTLILQLKKAKTLLGVLELYGGDFPWHDCKFEPTAAFDEVRPLFERMRTENWATSEEEEELCQQIEALGLRLVRGNGEEINLFWLHIHDHEAKLQFDARIQPSDSASNPTRSSWITYRN